MSAPATMRAWLTARLRPQAAAPDRDQIVPLQLLRGIAASGVVVEHLLERYARRGALPIALPDAATRFGEIGVATFFVISGFIMVFIARGRGEAPTGGAFLRARFLRIAPLYYLTTGLMLIFGWFTHPLSAKAGYTMSSPAQIAASLLFVPHRNDEGVLQPAYRLGWTLDYEMFFYLLFAVGLAIAGRRGVWWVLGALGALIVAGTAMSEPAEAWGLAVVAWFLTRPIIAFFAIGMTLALIRERIAARLVRLPMGAVAILAFAMLVAACLAGDWRVRMAAIALGVAATVLTDSPRAAAPATVTRARMSALARAFGDASYSIYLTHSFLLGAVAAATATMVAQGVGTLIAMGGLACALCFGAGWLCWRLVELPLTQALRGRRPSRAQLVAP